MPARKVKNPLNDSEVFLQLAEDLNQQATRPNINGYKPHFKQVKFHTFNTLDPGELYIPEVAVDIDYFDVIDRKELLKKVRLYIGGNRSGKTVGGIVEDIWWVTKKHPFIDVEAIWPEPIRGRVCTVDFNNGLEKIIMPEVLRWCPRSELRGGSFVSAWDSETKTLHFKNRGFIEFMSYEQDLEKFAGTSRHFVHFDEEPRKDIYTECMARLVDTGGVCWFTMTPVEGMTWTFDTIYEPGNLGEDANIIVVEVDLFDNPFVSKEEKDILVSLYDAADIDARVHGKFVRRGGLIYAAFDEKIHVIEPQIPSRDYLWIASVDHGFRNPTAWLWHAVNHEGRVITFHESYAAGLVVSEHAKKVNEINKQLGRPPDFYVGDPSIRNKDPIVGTSVLEEYIKYGIPIVLGNNDVAAGINRMATYLIPSPAEDGKSYPYWVVTENCSMFIWEIKRYRWASWIHRRTEQDHNVKEEPIKKDDHAMDSARYFIMSRPDLRADMTENVNALDRMRNVVGTVADTYVVENKKSDMDWEQLSKEHERQLVGSGIWDKEYSTNHNWQTEEIMGGEW